MVRRVITDFEKNKIAELYKLGKNNDEIANTLGWTHKNAHRSVARQITKLNQEGQVKTTKKREERKSESKMLDEMTRDERYIVLKNTLEDTPRFKMVFESFSKQEKELFLDEYLKIVRSTDTLNEAEEQALFSAILEYVLAFRALRMKRKEEELYEKSMNGDYDEGDAEFRTFVDGRFQKEYESHMNRYEGFMKSLKMSRDQRLKDVTGQRKSLTDVAEELSNQSAQSDMVEEIERLSKASDAELKRMLTEGYIFGDFEQ